MCQAYRSWIFPVKSLSRIGSVEAKLSVPGRGSHTPALPRSHGSFFAPRILVSSLVPLALAGLGEPWLRGQRARSQGPITEVKSPWSALTIRCHAWSTRLCPAVAATEWSSRAPVRTASSQCLHTSPGSTNRCLVHGNQVVAPGSEPRSTVTGSSPRSAVADGENAHTPCCRSDPAAAPGRQRPFSAPRRSTSPPTGASPARLAMLANSWPAQRHRTDPAHSAGLRRPGLDDLGAGRTARTSGHIRSSSPSTKHASPGIQRARK